MLPRDVFGDDAVEAAGDMIKMVGSGVDVVLNELLKGPREFEDDVYKPVREMIRDIEEYGIWKGKAAQNFVIELKQNLLQPGVSLAESVDGLVNWLQSSRDMVHLADRNAMKRVQSLVDEINKLSESV